MSISKERLEEIRSVIFGNPNQKVPTYAEVIEMCNEIIKFRTLSPTTSENIERHIKAAMVCNSTVYQNPDESARLNYEKGIRFGLSLASELKGEQVPAQKPEAQIARETLEKVCEFLDEQHIKIRNDEWLSDYIQANADRILK